MLPSFKRLQHNVFVANTMQRPHTWTAVERRTAKAFAHSLCEARLNAARSRMRLPSGTADEIVKMLSDDKEQLMRVNSVFEVKKPDVVSFFGQERPPADLQLTKLSNTPVEELCAWLESYFTQVTAI